MENSPGSPLPNPNIPPIAAEAPREPGRVRSLISRYAAKLVIGAEGPDLTGLNEQPPTIPSPATSKGTEVGQSISELGNEVRLSSRIALAGIARVLAERKQQRVAKKTEELELSADVFKVAVKAVVNDRMMAADVRPITNLQTRQALRASRRRHKAISQHQNQLRMQEVFGEDIGDKAQLEAKIAAGRYTRSEKTAMRRTGRQVRRVDRRIGEYVTEYVDAEGDKQPIKNPMQLRIANSPKLARSSGGHEDIPGSTGTDIPGRTIAARLTRQRHRAATADEQARNAASLEEQKRRDRDSNRAARQARKQNKS